VGGACDGGGWTVDEALDVVVDPLPVEATGGVEPA
jgi:hypothetical protein